MASTYSTNLKIELIPTGAQAGIWGQTTNANLGSAIEQAIVGLATCPTGDFVANVATYTLADSNTLQTARAFCLNVTATLTAAGTINVPAIQKPYLVFNNSAGGFAVTVKVSGQTGVSVPNGKKVWLYNNGTDVGVAFDYAPSLTLGTALSAASGGTGLATYAIGDLTYASGTTALSKLPIGTNTYVLASNGTIPQWVSPTTLPVATATNLSGGTTGASPYQSAPGVTTFLTLGTSGQVMTAGASGPQYVNQSTLSVGSATTATTATTATSATTATNLAGGTANQVAYQTGVGATSFIAAPSSANYVLTWNGSALVWASVPTVTSAGNLIGGSAGVVPYQSATGVTSFTAAGTTNQVLLSGGAGSPTWANQSAVVAGTATNIAGGIASQIVYQTGAGATGFIANGVTGQVLQSNGTSAPTWINTSTIGTSNGKLYFFGQF